MNNITAEEKLKLKGQGVIPQRQEGYFSCRVITKNGCSSCDEINKISHIAEKYGKGYLSYTNRLTIEIPWIKYEDIKKVQDELKTLGMYTGGTGKRIRPLACCKGTTCVHGLIDTQKLAEEMHDLFYEGYNDVILPHKFKIGIGGCPNNCVKPDLNDFGIVGQRRIEIDTDKCKKCKKCGMKKVCLRDAITKEDTISPIINRDKCVNCGDCFKGCYFDSAYIDKEGFKIYLGGRWGKKHREGNALPHIYTKEEMFKILRSTLNYFKENGNNMERFGEMMDRIGSQNVINEILKNSEI